MDQDAWCSVLKTRAWCNFFVDCPSCLMGKTAKTYAINDIMLANLRRHTTGCILAFFDFCVSVEIKQPNRVEPVLRLILVALDQNKNDSRTVIVTPERRRRLHFSVMPRTPYVTVLCNLPRDLYFHVVSWLTAEDL
eukprot:g5402.t1